MIFLLFIPLLLFSRLNPFQPVITPQNTLFVNPKFTKKEIYLPQNVKVLKKILITYEDINGDIKRKEITIDKEIDFNFSICIIKAPTIKKADNHFKKVNLGVIKLILGDKKIFIQTKDKLINSFHLFSPFRIVLDFKRDSDFETIKKDFNSFVKRVIVGAHGKFYRVVFYFDKKYLYNIIKKENGVLIEFK